MGPGSRDAGAGTHTITADDLRAMRRAVEGLEGAVETLASKKYVEEVSEAEARKRKHFGWLVGVVGICFVLMFILLAAGLLQLTEITTSSRENTNRLVECTTASKPGDPHECFEMGNRRTGEAISQIVERIVAEMTEQHTQMARGQQPR